LLVKFLVFVFFFFLTGWPCTAQVGSCSPWNFLHQGGFLGHSIFSAWVWPPGDARQFAREPVSCDSSVCVGNPERGPMFDRLVCACGDGYPVVLWGLARRPLGKCPFCQASLLHAGWVLKAYLRVGWTQTSAFFRLVTSGVRKKLGESVTGRPCTAQVGSCSPRQGFDPFWVQCIYVEM
jgi:hypothetical protein